MRNLDKAIAPKLRPAKALAILYAILTVMFTITAMTHYLYGLYDELLITLIAVPATLFASLYLYLIKDLNISLHINRGTLILLGTLMQYQLHVSPEIGMHWIFSFPLLSYFTMPLRMAATANLIMLLVTIVQLTQLMSLNMAIKLILVYLMLSGASWCYAYLNQLKQMTLLQFAVTDDQSGAYNSQHLSKVLEEEIARSKVTRRTLSIIAITIEAFHDGQGTFYLLLPNCPMDGAVVLKERLQIDMSQQQWHDIGELQLSAGIATLNEHENADSFLRRASQHLLKQQQTALRFMAFN